MAYTRAGIKRLVMWTPDEAEGKNTINLDIRSDAKLSIEDIGIDDVRGRQLPTYTKFKVEATSHNIGRPIYYYLLQNAQSGQVQCEGVLTPSTSGVLQITGSNFLGIDFEYGFSGADRNAKITLEGNFEKATGSAIINNFVTATPMTSSSLGLGSDYSYTVSEYFSPSFGLASYGTTSGSFTALFSAEEIKERTFTAKSISRKNVYEKSLVDYVEILAEYTIHNASATKVKALNDIVTTTFAPTVKIQEKNGSASTETHVFNLGVLSLVNMSEFGETDRFIKLTFKGKVPLDQISHVDGVYTYTL